MSNRKTPQDYHAIAKSKGFEWVGPEVNTVMSLTCCRLSKGAKQIALTLSELGIRFITDKTIPGCKDKVALMFDFYFEINGKIYLIEYDGRQHFKRAKNWSDEKQFKNLQYRDEIKDRFAQENNYHLIRVRYDTRDIRAYLLSRLGLSSQPARKLARLEALVN